MTAVVSRSPAPGDSVVGRKPTIIVSVSGDVLAPIVASDLVLYVSGEVVYDHGQAEHGVVVSVLPNIDFGVDITVRLTEPLDDNQWQSVRVQAPDLDDGWSFRVLDVTGPRLINVTPERGSDSGIGLPLIEFDVVDDSAAVAERTLLAESNVGSRSGSQLTVADIDFMGMEGRCVEIASTPGFITTVLGPHDVITTLSGGGTGLNVKLFQNTGLDVTVLTEKVIKSGVVQSSSAWTPVITTPIAGQFHVALQKITTPIADGTRVDVWVRAQSEDSDAVNVSDLWTYFTVGDNLGPHIGNVSPVPGTRGLSTSTATQPTFDVVDDDSGLDAATLNVTVNGVVAILNGVAQGDFSTSTLTNITGGKRIVIKKSTSWPGPMEVMVLVTADDNDGNAMRKQTWLWHFGATSETFTSNVAGGQLVSNDVIRVVAFDFSAATFSKPAERELTGYGQDGYKYTDGTKRVDLDRASWALEAAGANRSSRSAFPVSGYLVVSGGSWSILDASGAMWMRCTSLASVDVDTWSMAGSTIEPIADAFVCDEKPVFFFAIGASLLVVDFVSDYAWRVNDEGMTNSAGLIASRDSDQAGGVVNIDYALSAGGDFTKCTGWAWSDSWFIAGVRDAQMDIVAAISDDDAAPFTAARGEGGVFSARSVKLTISDASGGAFARMRAARKEDANSVQPLLIAFMTSGGACKVLSCDWADVFAFLKTEIAILSVASEVPADIDFVFDDDGTWIVAVATEDRVKLMTMTGGGGALSAVDDLSQADLGLNVVSSGVISAVALAKDFQLGTGYLFAAATNGVDGKAVRWRHQPGTASGTGQLTSMATGVAMRSVASLGLMRQREHRFVRASMALSSAAESFVRGSMTVE